MFKARNFFFLSNTPLQFFFSTSSSPCTLSPHRFPTTDNFQWPHQSLEILLQCLVVEVSTARSRSMKCLWNSVCLSGVGAEMHLAGVKRWWYACRITSQPVIWVRRAIFLASYVKKTCLFLWTLNSEPDMRRQGRFKLAHCPSKIAY